MPRQSYDTSSETTNTNTMPRDEVVKNLLIASPALFGLVIVLSVCGIASNSWNDVCCRGDETIVVTVFASLQLSMFLMSTAFTLGYVYVYWKMQPGLGATGYFPMVTLVLSILGGVSSIISGSVWQNNYSDKKGLAFVILIIIAGILGMVAGVILFWAWYRCRGPQTKPQEEQSNIELNQRN